MSRVGYRVQALCYQHAPALVPKAKDEAESPEDPTCSSRHCNSTNVRSCKTESKKVCVKVTSATFTVDMRRCPVMHHRGKTLRARMEASLRMNPAAAENVSAAEYGRMLSDSYYH